MIESTWENSNNKKQSQINFSQVSKNNIQKTNGIDSNDDNSFFDSLKTISKDYPTPNSDRIDFFPKTPETVTGYPLNGKHIGDSGVLLLTEKLAHQNHTALFLANNNIGDSGLKTLASFLKPNTSVKHLILSHNKITHFAMAALADLLKVNHHIGWLILNGNAVGNFGIKSLSDALSENKGVKHLILSDNKIGDDGIKDLCNGLTKNTTLQSLFLQGNPFSDEGVSALIMLLSHSTSIKTLDIRDIGDVDPKLITELKERCDSNSIRLYVD